MARNAKATGCGAKQSEIYDSGLVATCIWSTFDLLVSKVILGSFSALVSKCPVTHKQLAIVEKGVKFGLAVVVT